MKRYLRPLIGLIGLVVLCLTQLGATAQAGIGGATFRVNLSVATAPSPTVQPTVNGSFTYGITCTAPSGPVFTFASPAMMIAINTATPTTGVADVTRGSFVSAPNTCTVVQLTRPAPPAGFSWNSPPPNVVLSNVILTDPTTVYAAAFANVLSLPIVTGAASPTFGGSVSCTNPVTPAGTATCLATANPGFAFTGFATDSCGAPAAAGAGTSYTTLPLGFNCIVTAGFSRIAYTVTSTANPAAGGTVSCDSPVSSGTTSTCTATANSGYTFSGFSTNGCGGASSSSPYITSPLSANCIVNAAFTQNPFIITAVASPLAGGTITCTSPVTFGTSSNCTATPNSGYAFTGVTTSSCGAPTALSPFSTAAVTSDCTVTATFSLVTYIVTGVPNPIVGGNVTCTSPVNSGATSSCTATPNSGYSFTGFSTNACGAVSTANPMVTAPITATCTVTAAFSLNTYTIATAANPISGGTVSCAPNPVSSGSTASCTATANSGYTFSGFTTSSCGAASVSNPYVTNAITSACTVTAAFRVNTVPVTTTVNVAAGGSVNCTPNPVVIGSAASCIVVTNAGYVLTGVSGCGGATTAAGTFVTAPITAACAVAAAFVPFVLAPSVPVPTSSGWMLILLTLLVVGIGGAFCARRLS